MGSGVVSSKNGSLSGLSSFPFLDVRYGWEVGECVPAYVRECVRGCVCAFVYGDSASYLVLQCALLLLPDLMGQLIHTLSHDIPYLSVA